MKTALLLVLPLVLGTVGPAQAPAGTALSRADLGVWWHGAPIEKDDLTGKAVLLVIWGS